MFTAYLQSSDTTTQDTITKFLGALQTLSYCSKIAVSEAIPSGCTIITVSDKCQVHLFLKGLIEPSKEIAKIQKKIEFLQNTENKLNQAIGASDYTTKVPQDVQDANSEKLSQTTVELKRLQEALAALRLME